MFWNEFYQLLTSAVIFVILFYLLSQLEFFKGIFYPKVNWIKRIVVFLVFLSIYYTYTVKFFDYDSHKTEPQLITFLIVALISLIIINKILANIEESYEHQEALQSDRSLKIAGETLPFLRRGLNPETAQKTAKVILQITDVSAVALTDREKVLAYEGVGGDHHHVGESILTKTTRDVLETGEIKVVGSKKEIGCPIENCPLVCAVVAPLKSKNEVIGTLKLYQTDQSRIIPSKINLAVKLAQLLSIQTELAELEILNQLKTEAELKTLRAQINPHFLFNTLNTIASFYRTQPQEARELLIKFSQFFRKSLKQHESFVSLAEELEYIDDYLSFEKARFGDSLIIEKRIAPDTLNCKVPVLILQPLVENALKHGFYYQDIQKKPQKNIISISAKRENREIQIIIRDDGVGMQTKDLPQVFESKRGTGLGINNVYERLKIIYGKEYEPRIESEIDKGTKIILRIPIDNIEVA